MNKIDLITEKEVYDKNNSCPFTALLFLISGVYGGLLFLQSIPGIIYSEKIVLLTAAVLCTGLWYAYFYRKRIFPVLIILVLAVSVIHVFRRKDILMMQLAQIIGNILGKADMGAVSVTEMTIFLTVFLSVILFAHEIILQSHAILYLLTTGLLLLGPLVGIRPGSKMIVFLFFYQITFWTLSVSKRGMGSTVLKEKSIWATAAFLMFSFLVVFPFVSVYTQELFNFAFEAEGYVYRTVDRLSGKAGNPVTGGRIRGGNHYQTGAEHLELTISRQPTETLYLCGFNGGEYTGGNWIQSNDEELFSVMAEKLDWQEWEYMVGSMYYNMYFVMNSNMQDREEHSPFWLTIRHLNGDYRSMYVPYYSQIDRRGGTSGEGYGYQYFEQSDMEVDWNNVSENFEQPGNWYKEVKDAYVEEMQSVYTQVPAGLLPRLTKLVEENPLNEVKEISAFILYTLHSNASYTLTPGWTPFNTDIAEYFLFESGQGYCEHFALTATLLYRMYGIPARYAAGYMVLPEDFERQEDGTWKAMVTDKDAHAWTEIFLDDYGWTPVEVTPAEEGSTVASYPDLDSMEINRIFSEKNWNMDIPSLTRTDIYIADTAGKEQNTESDWKLGIEKYEKLLWIIGIIFLYTLLLTPLFLDYRRLRHLKKTEMMSCRKVFSKFMQMLYFAGYFHEYDGSEKEFAAVFTAQIPIIHSEEIRQLQNIVWEAAYGAENPSMEKEAFVKSIYFRTSDFIYEGLDWKRKWLFRYWNTFG